MQRDAQYLHMARISFNDFRSQLRTWQPRISEGEVIELISATCRYRQESRIVAYAVHVGIREQLPQLPIVMSKSFTHYPKEAIAVIQKAGGCVVRGDKLGDRFILLSPELYAAIMADGAELAPAQIVS